MRSYFTLEALVVFHSDLLIKHKSHNNSSQGGKKGDVGSLLGVNTNMKSE